MFLFSGALDQQSEHAYLHPGSSSTGNRIKLERDFNDWKDHLQNEEQPVDDIDKYVQVYTDEETNSFNNVIDGAVALDIFRFWSCAQTKHDYPLLSWLAVEILCIPASSTSCEQAFSTAGRILEQRRTRQSDKSVVGLLFLHSRYTDEEQA